MRVIEERKPKPEGPIEAGWWATLFILLWPPMGLRYMREKATVPGIAIDTSYHAVAAALFLIGFSIPLIPLFAVWRYFQGTENGSRSSESVETPISEFTRRVALWSALAFGPLICFLVLYGFEPSSWPLALLLAPIWVPFGIYATMRLSAESY